MLESVRTELSRPGRAPGKMILMLRLKELVDATFWGWGGHGAKTRTRDRGSEPVAKKLKV